MVRVFALTVLVVLVSLVAADGNAPKKTGSVFSIFSKTPEDPAAKVARRKQAMDECSVTATSLYGEKDASKYKTYWPSLIKDNAKKDTASYFTGDNKKKFHGCDKSLLKVVNKAYDAVPTLKTARDQRDMTTQMMQCMANGCGNRYGQTVDASVGAFHFFTFRCVCIIYNSLILKQATGMNLKVGTAEAAQENACAGISKDMSKDEVKNIGWCTTNKIPMA